MIVPSDSIATVSVSESGVSQSSSTLTPDSSISSIADYHADVLLKKVVNSVQGKAISNPLPAMSGQGQKPGSQPTQEGSHALPNHVPGWTELTVSPTFNLISLQEAQAQARERSRTHTQVTNDPHLQTVPPRNNPIALSGGTGRLRSRTASAGPKTKADLTISNPIPLPPSGSDDSQAAPIHPTGSLPRTLKQKKSGFMRLFNGKDKDKPTTPSSTPVPPVPAPSIPRTPKLSSARVPVPSLSPSLISQSPLQFDGINIVKGDGPESDSAEDLRDQRGIKRHVPTLSIYTQDPSPTDRPNGTQSARLTVESTPLASGVNLGLSPASAPPSTTTFSGLSLRPMSTLFSAHFADHIVSVDSPPTASSGTTTTTGSGRSTLNSADEKRPAGEDDPYAIIQQLQEQMKATRKAWQHQIWELEGQVRDLRAEIDEVRLKELRGERCLLCGRSDEQSEDVAEAPRSTEPRPGIVDRPRARTGVGTRFGAAT